MKRSLPLSLLLLAFAAAEPAQGAPALGGTWYLNDDPDSPCKIILKGPAGRARFVNEKGSRAWGRVWGDTVSIPDWGKDGRALQGRIRGDRILWPGGSFWSRPRPLIAGTWYLKGDKDSPCKVIPRGPGGRVLFINEKGSRAWGLVRGEGIAIPGWGEGGGVLKGRVRGGRIEWPDGSFWSRPAPRIAGTWYWKGNLDSPCKIVLRKGGRALFVNEKGSRARGKVRGEWVSIPDWGEDGRPLKGRIRGNRIIWPGDSFWSRPVPLIAGTWYHKGDKNSPCKIVMRGKGGRALFVNEKGSRARGKVRGEWVFVPGWGEKGGVLEGHIRTDLIEWPDGSFWSR